MILFITCREVNLTIRKSFYFIKFNDTHKERLVFHSIQYRNGWLAASDLFDMFTQSIKFYTSIISTDV